MFPHRPRHIGDNKSIFRRHTRVFTTPVSDRMRGLLAIGELVGFNNNYIEPNGTFEAEAEKYTQLAHALREKNPFGTLMDTGLDTTIRRILFPNSVIVAASESSNLIARMQEGTENYNTPDTRKITREWGFAAAAEIEFLQNARQFYKNGINFINDSTYLQGLTEIERYRISSRIESTHASYVATCDDFNKDSKFMNNELSFLWNQDTVDKAGNKVKRNPTIKEVKEIFSKNNSLSLLRYFLTRLWILEFYSGNRA